MFMWCSDRRGDGELDEGTNEVEKLYMHFAAYAYAANTAAPTVLS
jgi:hypothetical protein